MRLPIKSVGIASVVVACIGASMLASPLSSGAPVGASGQSGASQAAGALPDTGVVSGWNRRLTDGRRWPGSQPESVS